MSLLLSEGHADSRRYPIAVVWSEARIVRQRRANRLKEEAVVMQSAIFSAISKEAGNQFKKLLNRIDESD